MAHINIVVGTVMGTTLDVAKTAQSILEGAGHSASLVESYSGSDMSIFDPSSILLVCTSSTGMGDLPQNIVPFYLTLTQKFPAIAGMKFGLISLGDSSYPNFAQAGNIIEEALLDIGAVSLGDKLVLDAITVDDHEEEAEKWLQSWVALLPN